MNHSFTRSLKIVLALLVLAFSALTAQAAPNFSEVTGAANPFNGVDVGTYSAPTLADVDGDGDLDAFIGRYEGVINFYRNDGTATAPSFSEVTGAANPFDGVDVGWYSAPTLADVDGDGDLDAFIGVGGGFIHFYRNDGTVITPSFSEVTGATNPFNGVDVGSYSVPTLTDVDGDGDLDVFIGEENGNINFYRNTGTVITPSFSEVTGVGNPFDGMVVGNYSVPTLTDLDGDGDLDAFIGENNGNINFYRNDGTATVPSFSEVTGAGNPFDGVVVGTYSAPTLADVDGDGDLDAFIGEYEGVINFYRNGDTPVSASFSEVIGPANPFDGVDVGGGSAPTLADVDSDGDLDAFIGVGSDGVINFYRNTGTVITPSFSEVTGSANPLDDVSVGEGSVPTLADVDGDGDLDAFIGEDNGTINFYRNDGTATTPSFSEVTGAGNPFDGVDVGSYSAPTLADIDGDGDLDAFIGEDNGTINFYRNDGTATTPSFSEVTGPANPFDGVDVGACVPTLADVDSDGDLDAFIGAGHGGIHFYRNDGTATTPSFSEVTGPANPFNGVDVGAYSAPTLADIDGDGDLDAFIGEDNGTINFYRNGPLPEMAVLGNGAEIADGDTTPSPADHTDFGSVNVGQVLTRTFTISNSGTADLSLTGSPLVTITGAAALDFSLVVSPTTPVLANATTTFQVRFNPTILGTRAATLTIANNDSDENPYDFAIQGTETCPSSVTVTNANNSGAGSLRQAIADVCAGGTITFAGDTAIYLDSQLDINKTLTIDGQTHAITVSGDSGNDGSRNVRVFNIQSSGVATLTHLSVVSGTTTSTGGGGIYNQGTLTVQNSTLAGNSVVAPRRGGGIYNLGPLTIQNSTFSENSADFGGGIANWNSLTIQNGTFSGNSASNGGGIFNNGTLDLTNTLIANSSSGGDCRHMSGSLTSEYTLIEAANVDACKISDGVNGNIIGVDPLLTLLGSYGGSTRTFALLPGSRAIDTGNNATCQAPDQRGITRPQPGGGVCDIGAFESQGFNLTLSGGTPQSTLINTAFANPLALTVSSSAGEPVEGGQVLFTGPDSGTGTTPTVYTATISSGVVNQSVTANATTGSYVVTATARGNLGGAVGYNLTNTAASAGVTLYLPFIFKDFASGPDLVIDSLAAGSSGPQVVIRNIGDASVNDGFWVDVYFNPTQTPSLNQRWNAIAPAGAVWGVTQSLAPGESLTLTVGGAYYDAGRSSASFPAGAQVYGLVDSVNLLTTYGGVYESNESNNLAGPVVSAASDDQTFEVLEFSQVLGEGLPER